MERLPFNSGTILEAGWSEGTLEIQFNSLSVYRYKDVPKRIWDEFQVVRDKGVFFCQFVRGAFEYECIHKEPSLFPSKRAEKAERKAKRKAKAKASV